MNQLVNSKYPSNSFGQYWMKVPLVLRSIIIGFGVSSLGVGIWTVLALSIPGPWSVLLMGLILVLFWMYFGGRWKPESTQAFRRSCIREVKLNRSSWLLGMVAAISIVVFLHASFMMTFRIVEFQPGTFKNLSFLNDLPELQSWSFIIGISMVAGICEEIGYRGYLQKPLEQKYGPVFAITIASVVFLVIHLHQSWLANIVVPAFIVSFMIGYLAFATNSLIPGILAHISFDIINVSYWWSDVMGTFGRKPVSMTGVDGHFVLTLILVLISALIYLVTIKKLMGQKESSSIVAERLPR